MWADVFTRPRPVFAHRGVGAQLSFADILSARNDRALLVNSVSPDAYHSAAISNCAIASGSRLEGSGGSNPGSPGLRAVVANRGPSNTKSGPAKVRQPAHYQQTARRCCRDVCRGARAGGRLHVRDLWFLHGEPAVLISGLPHVPRPRDWHPAPNDRGPYRQGLQAACLKRYPTNDLL